MILPKLALRAPPVPSVMLLFWLQPVLLGCLLVRLPDVKDNAGLNKAELALALMGLPLASMTVLFILTVVLGGRVGTRWLLFWGFLCYGTTATLVGLATSLPQLFVLSLGIGASMALTEVGLNVHASDTEKEAGRLIMSRAHGCWSLGELCGGVLGAGGAWIGMSLFANSVVCTLLSIPLGLLIIRGLPAASKRAAAEKAAPKRRFRLTRPLFLMGLFLICFAMIEGIGADWSTIYLKELTGSSTAAAAPAYLLFMACLTAARFSGDWLTSRWGAVALSRFMACLCLAGLVLVAGRFSIPLVFAGFALLGAGVAVGFPLTMTAAGRVTTNPPTANISFVSIMGIFSFLTAPPAIGFIAEAHGLHVSYALMIPVMFVALLCSFTLNPAKHPPRAPEDDDEETPAAPAAVAEEG